MKQSGVVRYPNIVGVRLSAEQMEKLQQLAAADDRPPSSLARRLLAEAIERATEAVPA